MTGRPSLPQPWSSSPPLRHPWSSTQACHSAQVTSKRPMAKGLAMLTRCGGLPFLLLALRPMMKMPAGTTTNSGQAGQSRNTCPGLRGGGVGAAGAGVSGLAAGLWVYPFAGVP